MMRSKNSIVIFGGAGYIGSNLTMGLKDSYSIVIIDQVTTPTWWQEHMTKEDHLYICCDLSATLFTRNLPDLSNCQFAIILAAKKDVVEGEKIPYDYARDNLCITINCLELCHNWGIKNILVASSSAVYHTSSSSAVPRHCFNESDSCGLEHPLGVYGYTKKATEDLVKILTEKKDDVRVVILRYANPVGSVDECDDLFPKAGVMSILGSRPDYFIRRGECLRDYINIKDMIHMHKLLLDNWTEKIPLGGKNAVILNIGSGKSTRTDALVDLFFEVSNEENAEYNTVVTRVDRESFEALAVCVDMTKFQLMFPDWRPRYSVKDTVRDYIRRFPHQLSSSEYQ